MGWVAITIERMTRISNGKDWSGTRGDSKNISQDNEHMVY